LHRVVRENLLTLYAAVEEGGSGAALPAFVRKELEGYVACGLLSRGFALMQCEGCKQSRLVAFSCKKRGFCPSCCGRRMAQTAANLIDHVLPPVPLRQLVLTMPFELRRRLAYDGPLLGAVSRVFMRSVLEWYRRRMEAEGAMDGRSGAVLVIQRCSSDLRLNPHIHAVLLDGAFTEGADGELSFHALPRLRTEELADVLQIVRVLILRLLVRRGVVQGEPDLTVVDDDLAEREPALAQLASAAVLGQPPAGPALRRRNPIEIALRGRPGITVASPLSVRELGFSLHAATRAGAEDERAREALIKYILRPPVAHERLRILPNDLVRLELKKPWSDGTTAVEMDPLSLLSRLCAAVPPPRRHTVIYAGVLGAASKLGSRGGLAERVRGPRDCSRIRPAPEPPETLPAPAPLPPLAPLPDPPSPTRRSRYWPWLELLARTWGIDRGTCESCGGKMKLHALVQDSQSIARILHHLGEPTEAPTLAAARGPPYWKSRVFRQKPRVQEELFDT
jgi:hypothetical protein